jgi:3'-phosphoadenosine 5'-phosphosulfate sulfotransferase (PAPS reductase)/FAD synthetase
MICCICKQDFSIEEMKGKGKRYCEYCFNNQSQFMKGRKTVLYGFRSLPLELKIIKSQCLVEEAVNEFGIDSIYISYSGGKDSTVLSHLVRQLYPNILHIFSNTTNEYPETLMHINWEKGHNGMNLQIAKPVDKFGHAWNFKRVVEEYGYPMFTKRVANAIRTYRRAKTDNVRNHSIEYIERQFKKYTQFKECNISDKCCEKLKKAPAKKLALQLGMDCVILGILAVESRQREVDWLFNGCNVFYKKKDNQCRPLAFWTEKDIYDYIKKYNVRIPDLYEMGYERNGCMFCGFGIEYDCNQGKNRFERLALTHPKMYKYLLNNFKVILDECKISY